MFDRAEQKGYYYVPDLDRLPYWEYGFPLRSLIHWWSEGEAFQFVHGAAISLPGTEVGILMPGTGGSGKSTTALFALEKGFGYLGDDYVIVEPGDSPTIHAAYSSAKVDDTTLARHPWLRGNVEVWGNGSDKHVAMLGDLVRISPVTASLARIVLPRVARTEKSTLCEADSSQCLQAIAPTTVTHLPLGTAGILRKIYAACNGVATSRLELGTDLTDLGRSLDRIL